MVHMRFIGLGVPENKWADLLEEAARVLKRGGQLEIVEMHYAATHSSTVEPDTALAINFALPLVTALVPATIRPVFSLPITHPVLSEATTVYQNSACNYKRTTTPGLVRIKNEPVSYTHLTLPTKRIV